MVGVEVQGPYKEYIAGGVLPLDYMQHDDPPPFFSLLYPPRPMYESESCVFICPDLSWTSSRLACTPDINLYSHSRRLLCI